MCKRAPIGVWLSSESCLVGGKALDLCLSCQVLGRLATRQPAEVHRGGAVRRAGARHGPCTACTGPALPRPTLFAFVCRPGSALCSPFFCVGRPLLVGKSMRTQASALATRVAGDFARPLGNSGQHRGAERLMRRCKVRGRCRGRPRAARVVRFPGGSSPRLALVKDTSWREHLRPTGCSPSGCECRRATPRCLLYRGPPGGVWAGRPQTRCRTDLCTWRALHADTPGRAVCGRCAAAQTMHAVRSDGDVHSQHAWRSSMCARSFARCNGARAHAGEACHFFVSLCSILRCVLMRSNLEKRPGPEACVHLHLFTGGANNVVGACDIVRAMGCFSPFQCPHDQAPSRPSDPAFQATCVAQ